MYAICENVHSAKETFDRIIQRNNFSYNIMLAGYAQNGHMEETEDFFEKMPTHDCVALTTMITLFGESFNLQRARDVFESMPCKNTVSWNAMLAGYVENGQYRDSLFLFKRMLSEGMPPNGVTFYTVLAGTYGVDEGRRIHSCAAESGCDRHVLVANSLVNMYGKCGEVQVAREIFENTRNRNGASHNSLISAYAQNGQMHNAKKLFESMPEYDLVSWNVMISTYCNGNRLEQARVLYESMPEHNMITWTIMVSAFAHSGDIQSAHAVFERAPEPSLVLWNSIIGAYSQCGYHKEAIHSLYLMDLQGVKPCKVTFVSILNACACLKYLNQGNVIYERLVQTGLEYNVVIKTALVNMFAKCAWLEKARSVFNEATERDCVSWNAMIAAYTQSGQGVKGIDMFMEMNLQGIQPDEATFVSVIFACSHEGMLGNGICYFMGIISDYYTKPLLDHYICMVDLLSRTGLIGFSEGLVHDMPYEPDYLSWATLVAGSKLHGDFEVGTRAARNAALLDPDNRTSYIILYNMCGRD